MNNLKQLAVRNGLSNVELVLLLEPDKKDYPYQQISNRAQALFKMNMEDKPLSVLLAFKDALKLHNFGDLYRTMVDNYTNSLKEERESLELSQHEVGLIVLKHVYESQISNRNMSVIYAGHIDRLEKMDPTLMDETIKDNFCKLYSIKVDEI